MRGPAAVVASRRVNRTAIALAWTCGAALTALSRVALAQVAPPAPERLQVGEWSLAPVVEARVRVEGRKDLDGRDHGALLERTRLGVDAQRGPLEVRVVLQDARLWDLGGGSTPVGQLDPLAQTGAYEAWFEAHTEGVRPSFVRLGRQPVTWGEGRLLGSNDGSPTGRTLDAARGRWVVRDFAFEVLGASLSDAPSGVSSGLSTYGELAGVRAQWALDPLFAAELYGLARFAQQSPALDLDGSVKGETYTGALHLGGDGRGVGWGAEGALQGGHADLFAVDRLAWAVAGHVGYTFESVPLQPSARLGGSYASGADGGSKYAAFDPMLPDSRTWYGAMDLFTLSNVLEGYVRASIVPWNGGLASVEYRYARLAQAHGTWRSGDLVTIAPGSPNTDAELGQELDATLRWSPWSPVELAAGYSAMILGGGAKAVLAAQHFAPPDVAHFGGLQATLRLP